ncbi:hypothetical protein QR680_009162 [Steinernema hermaphroditum]|uniref:Uncharacterized protein n=1 Tax=Steinernema hermaphroditum TaxID=289476 RepID=A0AA39ILM9_9BILA|nr:hypothetical protein QR680_009162 [Steinernema hermaphroditum]
MPSLNRRSQREELEEEAKPDRRRRLDFIAAGREGGLFLFWERRAASESRGAELRSASAWRNWANTLGAPEPKGEGFDNADGTTDGSDDGWSDGGWDGDGWNNDGTTTAGTIVDRVMSEGVGAKTMKRAGPLGEWLLPPEMPQWSVCPGMPPRPWTSPEMPARERVIPGIALEAPGFREDEMPGRALRALQKGESDSVGESQGQPLGATEESAKARETTVCQEIVGDAELSTGARSSRNNELCYVEDWLLREFGSGTLYSESSSDLGSRLAAGADEPSSESGSTASSWSGTSTGQSTQLSVNEVEMKPAEEAPARTNRAVELGLGPITISRLQCVWAHASDE